MNTNSVIVDRKQCSDQSLVSAAMAGDVTAFTALCRLHSPRLLRTVRQITRNHEDAEDALQDAFMRAFVHLKSFDGRAQFATWLTRIALNSALMILRKRRHYPAVSIDSDREDEDRFASWEIADRADDPERRLLKSETAQRTGALHADLAQAASLSQDELRSLSTSGFVALSAISKVAEIRRIFAGLILRPGFLLRNRSYRNTQVSNARPGPPTQCSSAPFSSS
jgi:RNA polymerase sigma factor (sigma-70 family)